MSAPKGNKLWELRSKHGRDFKGKDVERAGNTMAGDNDGNIF